MFYPMNKRPDQKADAAGKETKAQQDILDTSRHAPVVPTNDDDMLTTRLNDEANGPERDMKVDSYKPHNNRKAADRPYESVRDREVADRPYDGGYGRGGDYYRREWPDCWGQCDAGKCTLHETHPGCCYFASGTNYGYRANAAQQAPRAGDDKAPAQTTYGREGGSSGEDGLVCWTDGHPYRARA